MRASIKSRFGLGMFGVLVLMASAPAQQTTQVPDSGIPVFRVEVVSRSIKVINFHHRQGWTEMDLKGTSLAPRAKGKVKVDSKQGATKVEARIDDMIPPQAQGAEYLTYVLWAITPEGRPENLGELLLDGDGAKLQAATELQSFGLIVTAEPYFAVTQPSDVVVMEALVDKGTTGTISPLQAKYELWPKGMYTRSLPNAERIWSTRTGKEAPSALTQAKHAIEIAKSVGAAEYASATIGKAETDLANAEAFFNNKGGDLKKIQTLGRNATQLAEDARLIAVKHIEEARQQAERQAAADRVAASQKAAEEEARRREVAESERRLALEREQSAKLRAAQDAAEAERARAAAAQADQQRMAAEAAKQQARAEQERLQQETARAEEARLQAEAERKKLRDQLREQLSVILITRETARGLIVNLSDVLFDTGQSTLRPGAREKLARISGILNAHPELKLEIEGHTDSVGGDSYNQALSERRAESVKAYLIVNGVKPDSIAARGFGKRSPVADNNTASGRQQNRRVEIVVSGESIQAGLTDMPVNSSNR